MTVINISAPDAKRRLLYGKAASDIFQDYVEPLAIEWKNLQPRPGHDYLNHACEVPWLVWNAIVFKDFYPMADRESYLDLVEKSLSPEMRSSLNFWIDRKRKEFGKYRFLFGDCLFFRTPDGENRCRADIRLMESITRLYGQYGEKSEDMHPRV